MSIHYKVQEVVGDNCITREDGQKVFEIINNRLKNNEIIVLDFENIGVFTSPFFNSAIGPLFKDFSREELRDKLLFANINTVGRNLLKIVIDNSSRYYSDDQFRKVQDNIIKQIEGEND